MIEICFHNQTCCVYKLEDWQMLRREHRIVGEILGKSLNISSLPLKILPEEAMLLVNKNLATVVSYPQLNQEPAETDTETYREFHDKLLSEQKLLYKELRKKQLEHVINTIVEGKKKKGDDRPYEEIFDEELKKSVNVTEDNMLWPVLMLHTDKINGPADGVSKEEVMKFTSEIKIRVFADLWEKGYYITSGNKFGGDFLVYLGDPMCCHAVNIIRCVDETERISPSEVIAFGRLGNSVKKRAVLATLTKAKDEVNYITLNWIDS